MRDTSLARWFKREPNEEATAHKASKEDLIHQGTTVPNGTQMTETLQNLQSSYW